jgi:hypothetical protein
VFEPYPPRIVIAGQILSGARSMVVAEAGCKCRTAFLEAAIPFLVVLTQFGRLGRAARSVVSAGIGCATGGNESQCLRNLNPTAAKPWRAPLGLNPTTLAGMVNAASTAQ